MKKYKSIDEIPFLQNVNPETIRCLKEQGKIVNMKKGAICYRASEEQDNVYIMMDGQAVIYTLTRCGNRKIIFIYGGGALLNESIISQNKTTVFCDTIVPSKVFVIRNSVFCKLMEQDFSLVRAVMAAQERKLWRTSHQLKNTLGSIYLEKKLAAKLWKLARDFGEPARLPELSSADLPQDAVPVKNPVKIDISLSITFLADLLGAPRETTSRVCKNLVSRGLIVMEKRTIIVRNMDCLSNFYKDYCGKSCPCDRKFT